jgi:endonuclease/exonuclease/phosphatase family metal-dependent hydrolase
MEIKTLQWNIGGGRICAEGEDPTDPKSYSEDGIDLIIEILKREQPDVITFQETHSFPGTSENCQIQRVAEAAGYRYWINHATDKSFIEEGMMIGQGIVSSYPIIETEFVPFNNSKFKITDDAGTEIISKSGGLTKCIIQLPSGALIQIETLHMVPFHFFEVDLQSEKARKILREVESKLGQPLMPTIVQADFNLDYESLTNFLPGVFSRQFQEVIQTFPTTPKGKRLDHVLFADLQKVSTKIISDVMTDHYPIITVFNV